MHDILGNSEVQCLSNRLLHMYEASATQEQIASLVSSPYFIPDHSEHDPFVNALGLVGLILLGDSNLGNQISGFNTLFSLFKYTPLINSTAIEGYAANGYKIYPVIVPNAMQMLRLINIADLKTQLVLERILPFQVPGVEYEAIHTAVKYGNHICGLTNTQALSYSRKYTLVMSGIVYMLMIKKPATNTADNLICMKRLWRIFCDALGVAFYDSGRGTITHIVMPKYKPCQDIYQFFSRNLNLRQHLLSTLQEGMNDEGDWGIVCRTVMNEARTGPH